MEALYDRAGRVYGWLQRDTGRIINPRGQQIAFIDGDSVYNWHGQHVAWWHDDHICSHSGQIALFLRGASGLGASMPALSSLPARPSLVFLPTLPTPVTVAGERASISSLNFSRPIYATRTRDGPITEQLTSFWPGARLHACRRSRRCSRFTSQLGLRHQRASWRTLGQAAARGAATSVRLAG